MRELGSAKWMCLRRTSSPHCMSLDEMRPYSDGPLPFSRSEWTGTWSGAFKCVVCTSMASLRYLERMRWSHCAMERESC